MEPVEYIVRPTTVKVYQFLVINVDEFIKMLWEWNYLTRFGGSVLVFQPAGAEPGKTTPTYRLRDGDYLIESYDADGVWKMDILSPHEFEKKYMPGFPENRGVKTPVLEDIPVPEVIPYGSHIVD